MLSLIGCDAIKKKKETHNHTGAKLSKVCHHSFYCFIYLKCDSQKEVPPKDQKPIFNLQQKKGTISLSYGPIKPSNKSPTIRYEPKT